MARVWTKIAIGCGIGCLVVAATVVGLGVGGWRVVSSTMEQMREATEAHRELVARFGDPRAWVPTTDGTIDPDRIELYLGVRQALAERRLELDRTLARLAGRETADGEGPRPWSAAQAGATVGPEIGAYLVARDRALLEAGMGPGEWIWIQVLAYHGWLGMPLHPPVEPASDDSVQVHLGGALSDDAAVRRARGDVYAMLRNLRDAAVAAPTVDAEWKGELENEMARLRDDPNRLPWQDGLPGRIAACFEPYRDRFLDAWTERTAAIDLALIGPPTAGPSPIEPDQEPGDGGAAPDPEARRK